MHFGELTAAEQRVLGCLIEKRWATPEQYPLSLNALRLACNQSTNRDPVVEYDEATVREAAQRLSLYGLARLASGHSSRAIKYRHLAEEALGLSREPLALLGVLLLRGPQTPGELKSRSERLARFQTLEAVQAALDELVSRGYAERMARRPGQKEERYRHLLGGDVATEPGAVAPTPAGAALPAAAGLPAGAAPPAAAGLPAAAGPPAAAALPAAAGPPAAVAPTVSGARLAPAAADGSLEERVASLEAEVARLREQLDELLA